MNSFLFIPLGVHPILQFVHGGYLSVIIISHCFLQIWLCSIFALLSLWNFTYKYFKNLWTHSLFFLISLLCFPLLSIFYFIYFFRLFFSVLILSLVVSNLLLNLLLIGVTVICISTISISLSFIPLSSLEFLFSLKNAKHHNFKVCFYDANPWSFWCIFQLLFLPLDFANVSFL